MRKLGVMGVVEVLLGIWIEIGLQVARCRLQVKTSCHPELDCPDYSGFQDLSAVLSNVLFIFCH